MADTRRKMINLDKYGWNPETKEKIHTHYHILNDNGKIVGEEGIKLNDGQKQKLEEARAACIRQSDASFEARPKAHKKAEHLRGKPKKEEDKKEEESKKKK